MPVPSGIEVAASRLPSAVPRTAARGSSTAGGHGAGTLECPGAAHSVNRVAEVDAGGGVVFGGAHLVAIAGPCVIESADACLRHAERIAKISRQTGVPVVFKSSFDKANRTSVASFRGPGLAAGLKILARV